MSKAYKIITGTAEQISAEATGLQQQDWLLKGDLIFTHMSKSLFDQYNKPMPMFAQGMFRKWEVDKVERQPKQHDPTLDYDGG